MCDKSTLRIISQSPEGYIGYCYGCDRYNLTFNNIFMLLAEEEIRGLSQIIDLDYGIWKTESALGQNKTITMKTPVPNTYFAFAKAEYERFKQMINETILVLDAKEIITNK
ncbi:DUF6686 family protein [Jiulongibacter sp. NS-SX5]|uniref:DUF6686 family protein n=1 Tax=Jiulongibacter sp. NS-SX5 TaxID=3463854 RepID=UPI0040593A5F